MTTGLDSDAEHEVLFVGRTGEARLRMGPALDSGRVLLAVAGDGDDWRTLYDHLGAVEGRPVDLVEVSHLDLAGSVDNLLPPLDGVEAAVVVLGPPDDTSVADGPGPIGHLIGLLHGRLGAGRVLVLVEASQPSLPAGTGVAEASYRQGRIGDQFPRVRALLAESEGLEAPPSGLLSRFGVTHTALAPELWLVLGPLLVLGAVLAVVGLGLLSWRSTNAPPTEQIRIDPAALVGGGAGSSTGATTAAGPGVGALPARCVVDLAPSGEMPPVIACDGAGRLMAEGYLGPWRNEVSTVTLDGGVIGQARLGLRPGQAQAGQVQLQAGADQSLASYRAGPGIDRIELTFAAYGQRVVLRQDRTRGGRQVTFTFTGA